MSPRASKREPKRDQKRPQERPRVLLGPLWHHFRVILGSIGDPFGFSWDPLGMTIDHFGPKSDAQASNMLILGQKALDRSMLMLLGCFKYVVQFLIVFCISVLVFRT